MKLRTRPAEILVSNWGVKDTAAFDINSNFTAKSQNCFRSGGFLLVKLQKLQNRENTNRMTQSAQNSIGSAFH